MVTNLEELLKRYKGKPLQNVKAYVYYRYIPTGKTDEMNLWEWMDIQGSRERRNKFEFIKVVDMTNYPEVDMINEGKESEESTVKVSDVPLEEDVLECPLCGFVAGSEEDLGKHKDEKHK